MLNTPAKPIAGVARPRKHVLALAAAGLALGAVPLTASAQQTAYSTSSVAVGACNLTAEPAPYSAGWYSNQISQEDLGYSFVDHNAVAATNVTLLVKGASATRELEDRGSFSPGVTIARNMLEGAAPESSSEGDNATCEVSTVDFADGTTWHAGTTHVASADR
jgi:hypothetical protein